MEIDTNNFNIVTAFNMCIFNNQNLLPYQVKYFKSKNLSFKEFEKIMKLSPIFSEHSSKYTKKMQKQILSIFDNN